MIAITRPAGFLNARIQLPASKSISNRLLILKHLYGPSLNIHNLSAADDTVLLSTLLAILEQHTSSGNTNILRLDTHNSGTTFRFLTALLSNTRGTFYLTGDARMKHRPIGPLVDALQELGAIIDYPEHKGYPPLLIKGRRLTGERTTLDTSQSSQYLSAILLIAPVLDHGLEICTKGKRTSWPYTRMTEQIMNSLRIHIHEFDDVIRILRVHKVESDYTVEPDWSAASFWYAMVALAGGRIEFPGLRLSGLQGDEKVADFFRELGVKTEASATGIVLTGGGDVKASALLDFTDYPDLFMPLLLANALLKGDSGFTGLQNLGIKESDRIMVMRRELSRAGIEVESNSDGIYRVNECNITPGELYVDPEKDHRVAMTMACLAVLGFKVYISDPGVVSKSYPGFWDDLSSAGFYIRQGVEKI